MLKRCTTFILDKSVTNLFSIGILFYNLGNITQSPSSGNGHGVSTVNTHTVIPNNGHPHAESTSRQGSTSLAGIHYTSQKSQNGHNIVVSTTQQGISAKTDGIRNSTFYPNQINNNMTSTQKTFGQINTVHSHIGSISKQITTTTGYTTTTPQQKQKTTKETLPVVPPSSVSNGGYNGMNNKSTSGQFKSTPISANGLPGVGNSILLHTTQPSKTTTKDNKFGQGHTKYPLANNFNQNTMGSTHQVIAGQRNLTGLHGSGGGSYSGNGLMGGTGIAGSGSGSGGKSHKQTSTVGQ